MSINVYEDADWAILSDQGLTTVVDPMIFRAAEVFVRGGRDDSGELKDALSKNIGALGAFFDALVYDELLPIFDYGISWEPDLTGASADLAELCNGDGEVLVPVHVDGGAYANARRSAIETLQLLPAAPETFAPEIRSELSAFDYRWRPRLDELGSLSVDQATLRSFQFGGLLFRNYAEAIGGVGRTDSEAEHFLHSKRESILGHMMLADNPSGEEFADVEALMKRIERGAPGAIKNGCVKTPAVLPYLLSKEPSTPRALLDVALKERSRGVFADLRGWRAEFLADLRRGLVRTSTRKELERVATEIERVQSGRPMFSMQRVSLALDSGVLGEFAAGHRAALLSRLGAKVEADLAAMSYWIGSFLPGRGFRRVLTQLAITDSEFRRLDRAVLSLWDDRVRG